MTIDLTIHLGQTPHGQGLLQAITNAPPSLLTAIGSAVAVIGILISAVTFSITQNVQRKTNRAETMQKLIEWFTERRASDTGLKDLSDKLVYNGIWTFSEVDLGTGKERDLAHLLSTLNHLAFYVDLGVVKVQDLARSDAGYHFTIALLNPSVHKYLNHLRASDIAMGTKGDTAFYYLRKYGKKISASSKIPSIKDGLLGAPAAIVNPSSPVP